MRRYRIAIATNGLKVVQRGRLARSTIRHHISEIIISEEITSLGELNDWLE
jgi:FMN phosphatase YigB (HAD superfamily)